MSAPATFSSERILRGHAREHGLAPALVAAVFHVEHRLDPNVRPSAAALGHAASAAGESAR
ncbi:MAG TPA: hypothetical protein VNJ53_03185 [Gaiellaceae bacterium]|nr:hypothetical protein [Gaiellaceae bacterium]